MAPSPFRRRKAAKAVRNLAIAEAAVALAKERLAPSTSSSRRPSGRLLLIGGAVVAAGAAALYKREKVAGLLPSRAGEPEPVRPAPPQPSNYDAPGPVANTATPVPAPDPQGDPPATIDEAAEEAAAAAEAAAIGGNPTGYGGAEAGTTADEAYRPLAESGEGESEGQEQAEAALEQEASFRDTAPSDAERQIEDTIAQADQPTEGETPEPLVSADPLPDAAGSDEQPPVQSSFLPPSAAAEPPPSGATDETVADTPGGGISGRPFAGTDLPAADEADALAEPTTDAPAEPAGESGESGESKDDDEPDDWRTWSGRSVSP
jgi:hypothetical protein